MNNEQLAKMVALKVIQFDGGIITVKGRVVVFMPVEVLTFLHAHLESKFGKAEADEAIFQAGKFQTVTGSVKYFKEKNDLKAVFQKVPMTGDPAIEMGREVLKFAGWGDNRFEEITENGDKIMLRTITSPIASEFLKSRGKSSLPVCHYLRGLLDGVVSSIYKADYESRETSCKATGMSEECIFEFRKK